MTADTTEPSPYGKERPALNDVQRIIIHGDSARVIVMTDEDGKVRVGRERDGKIEWWEEEVTE